MHVFMSECICMCVCVFFGLFLTFFLRQREKEHTFESLWEYLEGVSGGIRVWSNA